MNSFIFPLSGMRKEAAGLGKLIASGVNRLGDKMIKRPIKTMWDATLYDVGADTVNSVAGTKVLPTIFGGSEEQGQE